MKLVKPINPEIYLQQTMDDMFIHCFIIGHDWRFKYLNQPVADISKVNSSSLIEKDIRELFKDASNIKVFGFFKLCLETKTRLEFKSYFKFNNDEQRWFRFKVNPIDLGIFVVANEVTETVLAQEEIKKQKELLESAERIAHLGSWEYDFVQDSCYWSEEAYRILDYSEKEITPSYDAFLARVHPDDKELVNNKFYNSVANHCIYEVNHRIICNDGQIKYLSQRGETYYDKEGNAIRSIGTSQDISKQVENELLLKKSQIQYQQVVENINDGIIVYTPDEEIRFVNNQFLKMFGMTRADMVDVKLIDFIAEDFQEKLSAQHNLRISGASVPEVFEFKGKRKNGEERWFEARACNVILENQLANIQFALRDITKQKNWTKKLEIQNEELRKINFELDRFIYSASHDLRAPLLSLLGLIELTENMKSKEELADFMKMMRDSILRLDNSIKDMLDYSQNSKAELNYKILDVNSIINWIIEQNEISIKSKLVNIEVIVENESPFVSDKSRLVLILKNLISNAINYQRKDETNKLIKISFKSNVHFGKFVIEDNGEGIAPDKTQKIFDMFYRNSEQSEGTGLGLYLCKEAVNKLNGEISVNSIKGKGSVFTLSIPNININ